MSHVHTTPKILFAFIHVLSAIFLAMAARIGRVYPLTFPLINSPLAAAVHIESSGRRDLNLERISNVSRHLGMCNCISIQ